MPGARDPDWQADLARIDAPRAFLKEQSLWAIWVYRFGRRVDRRPRGIRRYLFSRLYWLLFRIVETVTGISLPKSCVIGKGLRIWHFGGVFLNGDAVLGENCTLRQGVTIGNREEGGGSPSSATMWNSAPMRRSWVPCASAMVAGSARWRWCWTTYQPARRRSDSRRMS